MLIDMQKDSINMASETCTIPKAVVHCQVREAKHSLLNYFYPQIGKREGEVGQMLDEGDNNLLRDLNCTSLPGMRLSPCYGLRGSIVLHPSEPIFWVAGDYADDQ